MPYKFAMEKNLYLIYIYFCIYICYSLNSKIEQFLKIELRYNITFIQF